MTPDRDELHEDAAAYVLGALAPDERARFEEHLRTCEECTAAVRSFRTVAGSLPYSVTQVAPPEALRQRVLDEAMRVRAPRSAVVPFTSGSRTSLTPPRRAAAVAGWLVAAASLALAVGLGVWGAQLQRRLQESELRLTDAVNRLNDSDQRLQASLRETTGVRQTLALLTAADTVELRLAGQAPARQASARAFLSRSRGVLFAATNLPPIPSDRTYQVWYLTRGAPVSAGLIKPDPDGTATARFDAGAIPTFAGMAVSLEPDGGVPAPTGAIYLATQ